MGYFLWLSDLHLDPLYGTTHAATHHNGEDCRLPGNATLLHYPFGRYGCDSPPLLLESSLQSAKRNANIYRGDGGDDNNSSNTNSDSNNAINFIVVTGDFTRHSTDKVHDLDPIAFTESVLSTSIASIASFFPGVPIIPVLGNNDLVPDYYLDTSTSTQSDTYHSKRDGVDAKNNNTNVLLAMVRDGLQESFLSEEEAQTFAHGGYFSRIIQTAPSSSILVLSVNTIVYSVKHEPTLTIDVDQDDDPLGQFEWIESQLRNAAAATAAAAVVKSDENNTNNNSSSSNNNNKIVAIYIVGHIPPSIGSYRHSQLWHDRYVDRYISILKAYHQNKINTNNHNTNATNNDKNNNDADNAVNTPPPPILGNLFGHVHTEEFRLLTYRDDDDKENDNDSNSNDKNGNSNDNKGTLVLPVHVTSSLTPIYGSNPSYRIVEYDNDSGALLDYTTHYLDLSRFPVAATNGTGTTNETVAVAAAAASWIRLPSFAESYGVPDLSSDSLERIIVKLEEEWEELKKTATTTEKHPEGSAATTTRLWDTFWQRQKVYSSAPDDGDDESVSESDKIIDWLCTLRAVSKEDYTSCLEAKRSTTTPIATTTATTMESPSDGVVLFLVAGTAVVIVGVLIFVFALGKQRCIGRRMRHYRRPSLGESLDGVVIVVMDDNAKANADASHNSTPDQDSRNTAMNDGYGDAAARRSGKGYGSVVVPNHAGHHKGELI